MDFFHKIRKEIFIAGLLSIPLLGLPLLAGNGLYPNFWLHLVIIFVLGGLADLIYCSTIRKLLTPIIHPGRVKLRWLIIGPPTVLLLLWLFHIPLITGSLIALCLGLMASLIMEKSLIWDSLISSISFGIFYVILFIILHIPISGPLETISSFTGIIFLSRPIESIILVFLFGSLWGPLLSAFRFIPEINSVNEFHPKHQTAKKISATIFIIFIILGSFWTFDKFVRLPTVIAASPTNGSKLDDITSPININFNRPIDRKQIIISIFPKIEGDISFDNPYLQPTFVRQIIFTPRQHLEPGTTYVIQISNLSNIFGRQKGEYKYSFTTPSLPTINNISIQNGQKNINICDPIIVNLDQNSNKLAEFNFILTPATTISTSSSNNGKTFTLTPNECLNQNTDYSLVIERLLTVYREDGILINSSDKPEIINTTSFTTKGAPGINGFTPQGSGILKDIKQLTISFNEKMATTDPIPYLKIEPSIEGIWVWSTDQILNYNITGNLTLDTKYTITIKNGLKDIKNGYLTQDASYSFTTIGHVKINSISPRSGSGSVKIGTPIRINFDQIVDHSSAEQSFSISPNVSGTFSWDKQTMIYTGDLQKDNAYQINIKAGVISQIGLPLQNSMNTSFSTEESITQLNIPIYYQQKPLSCEFASLKMALNYRGIVVDEVTLISSTPIDSTPRQGNIWGDPYQAFVGDINGKQNSTGYGIYSGPITALANNYRSTQALSNLNPIDIATYISKDNPVILWGLAGKSSNDPWETPSGRAINGWIGEHARLIIGFTGSVSKPTNFIINDPIFGRLRWTSSQLQSNMSAFGGMGVAIY